MNNPTNTESQRVRFEEVTPTNEIVVYFDAQLPDLLAGTGLPIFPGYDDLDSIQFAYITLPSGNTVVLGQYGNSPEIGVDLYVELDRKNNSTAIFNIPALVVETLRYLAIPRATAVWFHPDYETEIEHLYSQDGELESIPKIPTQELALSNEYEPIDCFYYALEIYTRPKFPEHWAMLQHNLGLAYLDRIKGERGDNLQRSIECYHNSLEVFTQDKFPEKWQINQEDLSQSQEALKVEKQNLVTDTNVASFSLRFALALANGALLSLWRMIYAVFLGVGHDRQVLIIGAGVAGTILAEALDHIPYYKIVGFIDDDRELYGNKVYQEIQVLGNRQYLLQEVERHGINEIILAMSNPIDDDLLQMLIDFHARGVTITPMPVLYEKVTGKVAVELVGKWSSVLPFSRNPFETFNRIGKRGLDLVCGLIIGLVLAVVFPFVAIAIKLDSPGAIFYKQERVGQHGVAFTLYKFRSMVQNAERNGKAELAEKGDAQITKVGNFIRKTRLDELPQVINVLRGDMSMVGPRPERHQLIQELQEQIPFYRTRLAVKPGLTGWAQINCGYGNTVEDALIKLQYDLYYLKHWSLWLDFKILLRTYLKIVGVAELRYDMAFESKMTKIMNRESVATGWVEE
jgi:exopolysaccharide biosynthesis polyprenyl glycosylphosphotransferase